ncbi:MAG TPA: ABC transporter substrate-binding protein [Rhizomicrobium sp.]
MARKLVMLFATLIALLPLSAVRAADTTADPAAQQIQTFYASLLETMKHGPELGVQGRYKALAPAIDRVYGLPIMMQLIVGPSWSTMAEADRTVLLAAFRRMTVADYASNFDKFSGEQFEVDPTVQQRGGDKIVQTKLIPSGAKPVSLVYRMREQSGNWKVIDVYLAGYVSQAALKRSDFASTLASGGPIALAAKINSIADNALAGAKPGQ